ncbi:iron-containing alcohol dehydrogenase [Clostridium luticellarii]|jgi:1,3-propanediol dehydrogenase/alcohol dehydrogenase|uniref:1,3-propanediol dehydrogenase n=1 Tax=Clostridium luticellarii TaxID=1691940 RepID=A0A2T0BSB5_9CLOT|nr:iron-containing alcohol dehydrogenase [Clostridium luticellarii]MCI1944737.1 iron-containing alcohol dehydrogenase [Clostridium luticellarii]MCI1968234.1 iron-containing alcohol dehydrogenase [Clostridium luticellarii]MCI1995221.1 iron-containing alcohol dehydrogenase [Clostridium luticellarii]MCI2041244.1 iron-containing alcohol dehydrogenase [Clostridium luticellarii]PRR86763.1 1,3-propanediol dehydrogenase [Clostridium luticellarii]
MCAYVFQSPGKIIYGENSVNMVGEQTEKYGRKVMIITGRYSSKKSGALDKITDALRAKKLDFIVFDKIESDPGVDTVRQGVKIAREKGIEVIVALGGGSTLDASKAISIVTENGGDIVDYESKIPDMEGIPIIAVPTTAGTGSEVSKFSVITDTERKIKMLISSDFLIPKVAVLDPELTMTMSQGVTAATGMDAFTHAIEAYISKAAQPMSDIYAVKAMRIISSNLSKAVLKGDDIEARKNMLIGQMYAGLAFSNSSTALVHSMSRPIGAYYGVAHGLANALLLTEVMKFNRAACQEKFRNIARAVGENVDGKSVRESSYMAVESVKNIFLDTGLPTRLRDVGVDKENFKVMAEDALKSKTTELNPRKPDVKQLVEIYEGIY